MGSGPNGLAAAIVLAQAGFRVDVLEAQPTLGGAARTMELTLPGFHHDFGSAVHPLAVGSPFFSSLPLAEHGLEWIHSPFALAHPFDDGSAATVARGIDGADALGIDRDAWNNLIGEFAVRWDEFAPDVLHPIPFIPSDPLMMARFGVLAVQSARMVARRFHSERTRALFAGMAAHSFLSLDEPLSAAFGLLMAISARAVGWPIPRGGAQAITTALCGVLKTVGGTVRVSSPVESLAGLPGYDLLLCDVTPRQLAQIGRGRLSQRYTRQLNRFRYGAGLFKIDYALRHPIPWTARACSQAATLHLGGSFDEIAASEAAVRSGRHAARPFVLLAQPSLFDDSRAPVGQHTAWAYCHVPNGSNVSALANIEDQIERFAPGFRDCILARRVFAPDDLEAMDANLVGGDVGGGAMDVRQFLFRPTWRGYATSAKDIYICSASTPPGGGVHGMCGYHAATMALARLSTFN
ncbi:MAG TPA: NAD(P)/FAD-dependent oxidoreductase [Candidatus Acidoferrum sp.]|nr:NAD(P)/FAD-dependent oxidoreductase [Candidatus Acidoferrum sp.]